MKILTILTIVLVAFFTLIGLPFDRPVHALQEKSKRGGISGLDGQLDPPDKTTPPAKNPKTPNAKLPGAKVSSNQPAAPISKTSEADKRIDRLGKLVEQLDKKQQIAVKIKSLSHAKQALLRYEKKVVPSGSARAAKQSKEIRRQQKLLQIKIKQAKRKIKSIEDKLRDGELAPGGVAEGMAVRELKLNQHLFEIYRESIRLAQLVEMWARERSSPKLEIESNAPINLTLAYKESGPKPKKMEAGGKGARGNVARKVQKPIHNANLKTPVYEAKFEPTFDVSANTEQPGTIVIEFWPATQAVPKINKKINSDNKTRLKNEAANMQTANIGNVDFKMTLTIAEIGKLRTAGKLEIDLSKRPPFQQFAGSANGRSSRIWKLGKIPKLVLSAKPIDSRKSNKNQNAKPSITPQNENQDRR